VTLVVGDDNHGLTLYDSPDQAKHGVRICVAQASGRLVDENERLLAQHRPGNRENALGRGGETHRRLMHVTLQHLLYTQLVNHLESAGGLLWLSQRASLGHTRYEVLAYRRHEESSVLMNQDGVTVPQVTAVVARCPPCAQSRLCGVESCECTEQRRFTCTGLTHETHTGSLGNREIDAGENDLVSEGHTKAAQLAYI